MSSVRDPEKLINAYLQDGLDELPERSYDAVRAAIDEKRQWAVIGPWKEPQIMTATRFALIAAAIAVVAVVAIKFLPSTNIGPGPTPTPVVTPSPTPSPSPTAAALKIPTSGDLAAGTYYMENRAFTNAKRLTFTVPAGWTIQEDVVAKHAGSLGEVMFVTWVVSHVFTDACKWDVASGGYVDVGTTADQLVSALADQKGRTASAATNTTVGGLPAKLIELTVPATLDTATCTIGVLRYWPDPGPDFSGGLCCNLPGNTDSVYAVDVKGKIMALVARHYPDSSPEDLAELQGIIDSIQIEP